MGSSSDNWLASFSDTPVNFQDGVDADEEVGDNIRAGFHLPGFRLHGHRLFHTSLAGKVSAQTQHPCLRAHGAMGGMLQSLDLLQGLPGQAVQRVLVDLPFRVPTCVAMAEPP